MIQAMIRRTAELGRGLYVGEVVAASCLERQRVKSFLVLLQRSGYIVVTGRGRPNGAQLQSMYSVTEKTKGLSDHGETCGVCHVNRPVDMIRIDGQPTPICAECMNGDLDRELVQLRSDFKFATNCKSSLGWF
jgi:hypothetical protein